MNNVHRPKAIWVLLLATSLVGTGFLTDTDNVDAAQQVTVTGVFGVRYGDPAPGSSEAARVAYSLTEASGQTWTLDLPPGAARAAGGPLALNRRTVQAAGIAAPGTRRLNVRSIGLAGGAGASPAPALPLAGSRKFATVLCKFSDIATEQQPLSFFNDLMGNTKPGANDYWKEVSYGNINLDGSAQYNWVTLPENNAHYFDNTDLGYPCNRSRLGRWSTLAPAWTTRGP